MVSGVQIRLTLSSPDVGCLCPEGSLSPVCTKAPCRPAEALPALLGVLRIKGASEHAGSGPGTSLSVVRTHSLSPSLTSWKSANPHREVLSITMGAPCHSLRGCSPSCRCSFLLGWSLEESTGLLMPPVPVLHPVAVLSVSAGAEPSADPCV